VVRRPSPAAARAAETLLRQAKLELTAAEKELKAARGHESEVAKRLTGVETEAAAAERRLAALSEEEQTTVDHLVTARGRLRNLAVGQYVTGGNMGVSLHYLVNAQGPEDLARRGALLNHASEVQRSATSTYKRANQAASEQIQAAVRSQAETVSKRDLAAAELQAASEQVRVLTAEVDNRRLLLDLATAAAPVLPSDIPRLFLDAYQRAASTLQREQPQCRVGWPAIAAIGKIESDHGRFRGAQTTLNGDPVPPIVGIRLDGSNSAVITDTDGGLLDGDPEFDRAVGPMQFIPSSWKAVARDGNGDGNTDPHNAYDAALGTAGYLCRAVPAGGLDVDEGLRPAFFSYNHSDAYVESVLGWQRTYAAMAPSMPAPPRPDRSTKSDRRRR
jgi:membrane-bound lytic murein transglycosylase B